ncbi:MAG: hypothetical protein R3330_00870, partial [Saprospiraceae bacterium]|nr:hypothetical protein [Saprospiraceae bacterium]
MRRSATNAMAALIGAMGLLAMISCKSRQIPPSTPMTPFDYATTWQRIDSLEGRELLQSALTMTGTLHRAAVQEKNAPQIIKSAIYLNKYAVHLNEDGLVHAIEGMEEVLINTEGTTQAVMYSLTAELYATYLQQNAWQLRDRTSTGGEPGEDIRTWDITQLIARINHYYLQSLVEPALKSTPVAQFEAILHESNTDSLRPAMFDVLAHRAIDYFQQDVAFVTEPVYALELTDPQLLSPWNDFINVRIATTDDDSYKLQVLNLFRQILQFHSGDTDPAALIDADLKRLQFVHNHLVHEDKDSLYLVALQTLREPHSSHPSSAEITYFIAEHFYAMGMAHPGDPDRKWALVEARELCASAIAEHPGTYGAIHCQSLLSRLLAPTLQVETEEVWIPGEHHLLHWRYGNVDRAYLRVVSLSHQETEPLTGRPEDIVRFLLRQPRVMEGHVDLGGTEDLRTHTTESALQPLGKGRYAVLISDQPGFGTSGITAFAEFQVSQLAFWMEHDREEARFVIVDRRSGMPRAGVQVDLYTRRYDAGTRTSVLQHLEKSVTSSDGLVPVRTDADTRSLV